MRQVRSFPTSPIQPVGMLFLVMLFVTILVFAGCSPSATSPDKTLPLPRVHQTTMGEKKPSEPVIVSEAATRVPTPLIATPSSLAELAQMTYGARLIQWIRIPEIQVFAPVTPVGWQPVSGDSNGEQVKWDSPDASVGWVVTSSLPGESGNTILYGHNNLDASVFKRLGELKAGDEILLSTGQAEWRYQISEVRIIPVIKETDNINAYDDYFRQTSDARLTVLSCWPPVSNTHRVIVIAYPVIGRGKE